MNIKQWNMEHHEGNIQYDKRKGCIIISTTGYYFVYSQVFYFDAKTYHYSHGVYKNNIKILHSSSGVANNNTKYNSKYNGAMFLLKTGDRISVRVHVTGLYNFQPDKTYIGAFFVMPRNRI